jgi:hypothetical protein
MAKKVTAYMSSSGIESIVNGEGIATAVRMPSPFGIHARAVTIVQHHDEHYGPHEPVYTESEVRAMLKDMSKHWSDAWNNTGKLHPCHDIAAKHGVDLFPK